MRKGTLNVRGQRRSGAEHSSASVLSLMARERPSALTTHSTHVPSGSVALRLEPFALGLRMRRLLLRCQRLTTQTLQLF